MVKFETFADYFGKLCNRNGISLEEDKLRKFYIHLSELLKWNRVHNLTALRDWKEIALRHFCDSLTVVKFFEDVDYSPSGKSLADVGSGAGFPGVPLKIYYGDLKVCLIENVSKKCSFLSYLKTKLKEDYRVLCEDAQKFEGICQIAIARALEVKGKRRKPLEYAENLLSKVATEMVVIMAGKRVEEEEVKRLNLKVYTLNLPDFEGFKILYKFKR